MNKPRIEVGDLVEVYLGSDSGRIDGKVLSIAQDTGDCWKIEDQFGDLHYIQSFIEIIKRKNM